MSNVMTINLPFKIFISYLYSVLFRIFRGVKYAKNNIKIAKGSYISKDVEIGRCTRVNNPSYIAECDIGAFCAIGGRLIVRGSNHSTNTINMQGWAQKKIIGSSLKVAGYKKNRVRIGNGVWIGDSVIILPGGEVGNGAVIGAGSVVTKPIPPLSIAVGNPAKVIKYRFPHEVIDIVKDIEWWNWSYKEMRQFQAFFEIDLESADPVELKKHLVNMGILRPLNDK